MKLLFRIFCRLRGCFQAAINKHWLYAWIHQYSRINNQAVLIESFAGNSLQCNPYYLFKELYNNSEYQSLILYVSAKDPQKIKSFLKTRGIINKRVKVVRYNSIRYIYALCTSKFLINNVSFNRIFSKKDEQVYLNTWHGTPLKCLGKKIKYDPFEMANGQRNFLMSDFLLYSNQATLNVFLHDYMLENSHRGTLCGAGYPRNEIFYDTQHQKMVREKLKLQDKKIVVYMPTWRGSSGAIQANEKYVEIAAEIASQLPPDFSFFIKLHPAYPQKMAERPGLNLAPSAFEVYEFLSIADILITDYSSVLFDFANTKRKIVLFEDDKESYFTSRGIYNTIDNKIPFTRVNDSKSLLQAILSPDPTTDEQYAQFLRDFCTFDHPNASHDLCHYFIKGIAQKSIQENQCRPAQKVTLVDLGTGDISARIQKAHQQLLSQKKLDRNIFLLLRPNKITMDEKAKEIILSNSFTFNDEKSYMTLPERLLFVLKKLFILPEFAWVKKKLAATCRREIVRQWGSIEIKTVINFSKKPTLSFPFNFTNKTKRAKS